ncbi:MAG: hypothetical protein ACM3O3_10925 [Syntrophothermus sp.]
MLLESNPGNEEEYGCALVAIYLKPNSLALDLILQPSWLRDDGYRTFRFVFGGIMWIYVVSSHNHRS